MAGHPKFKKVLKMMSLIHELKNSDYATEQNPFSNLDMSEDCGVPNWIGTVVRLGDKYSRIQTGCRKYMKGKDMTIKTEGIGDTLIDNAVYSIIAFIQFAQREGIGVDKLCYNILTKMGIDPLRLEEDEMK